MFTDTENSFSPEVEFFTRSLVMPPSWGDKVSTRTRIKIRSGRGQGRSQDEDDYLEGEASAEVFSIIDRADIDRAEVAGIPAGWRLQRGWRGQEGERLGLQARGHLVGLGGPEVI